MANIRTERWNERLLGPLSVGAIKRLHVPVEHYRFNSFRCAARTSTQSAGMAARCYVLEGSCTVCFDEDVLLRSGDVADIPAGQYSLSVGDTDLWIVRVFELPEDCRGSPAIPPDG